MPWPWPPSHPIPSNKSILVLGSGPIGLAVIRSIHAQAASPESLPLIIVSEPSKTRQQFARDFGVEHVISPITSDLLAQILELNNGNGVDLALDGAGVQVGVDQGLKCLCTRGTLLNVTVWEKRATLDMNEITFREKCYMGSAT
jgi:threonine dehydrogenase-like Zn-dependent dehydrogenase